MGRHASRVLAVLTPLHVGAAGDSQEAQQKLKAENDRLKDMINDLSIKNHQLQVPATSTLFQLCLNSQRIHLDPTAHLCT